MKHSKIITFFGMLVMLTSVIAFVSCKTRSSEDDLKKLGDQLQKEVEDEAKKKTEDKSVNGNVNTGNEQGTSGNVNTGNGTGKPPTTQNILKDEKVRQYVDELLEQGNKTIYQFIEGEGIGKHANDPLDLAVIEYKPINGGNDGWIFYPVEVRDNTLVRFDEGVAFVLARHKYNKINISGGVGAKTDCAVPDEATSMVVTYDVNDSAFIFTTDKEIFDDEKVVFKLKEYKGSTKFTYDAIKAVR